MKALIYIGIFVGGTIGSYIPVLFGQGLFSFTSILGSGVGSILGVWVGYKMAKSYL